MREICQEKVGKNEKLLFTGKRREILRLFVLYEVFPGLITCYVLYGSKVAYQLEKSFHFPFYVV